MCVFGILVNFTSFFTLIKSLDALPSTFYMNTLPNQHFLLFLFVYQHFFRLSSFFLLFTLKQIKLKMSSLHYPSYSSSSFLKRYVLQYTRLKRAKTNGKVIRDITSIRFDLEHCLRMNDWKKNIAWAVKIQTTKLFDFQIFTNKVFLCIYFQCLKVLIFRRALWWFKWRELYKVCTCAA